MYVYVYVYVYVYIANRDNHRVCISHTTASYVARGETIRYHLRESENIKD